MKAFIVHQAKILDPNSLPGYQNEVSRYTQATDFRLHGRYYDCSVEALSKYWGALIINDAPQRLFLPEGPDPVGALPAYSELITPRQFDEIVSGAAVGKVLYPHALTLLERLNLRGMHDLRDGYTSRKIMGEVYNLDYLRSNLALVYAFPILFSATIEPLCLRASAKLI